MFRFDIYEEAGGHDCRLAPRVRAMAPPPRQDAAASGAIPIAASTRSATSTLHGAALGLMVWVRTVLSRD